MQGRLCRLVDDIQGSDPRVRVLLGVVRHQWV